MIVGALTPVPTYVNATYTLSGGNLTVFSPTSVGEMSVGCLGIGQFNQTGGVSSIDLLAAGVAPGIAGIVNISGSASVLISDEVYLGSAGVGIVNQSGGKVTMGNSSLPANMSIGCSAGSAGTYNLSAGTLTVTGNVDLGGNLPGHTGLLPGSGGTGIFLVGPGALAAISGTVLIYNTPGTFASLSGGSFSVGVLDTGGNSASFIWTTGTLTLTNTNLAFDSQTASAADPFGPTFSLTSGQNLIVSLNESVGGAGLGSLTINAGSTNIISGNLSINTGGALNLAGGTLQAGSYNQAGGSISGTLVNQSTFNYQSGIFSGRLINQGSVNLLGNFNAVGGIENDAAFPISLGRTVTTGATGFDNFGTLTMAGGTLAGGPVVNDFGGTITGYGTIQPALTNNGSMNITGSLTLGAPSTNFGSITASAGALVHGSSITNNGNIILAGGAMTSSLANPAGGTITGNGTIGGGLTSSGVIQPGPGTLTITNAWTNAGLVSLSTANAALSGGAITNTSTIEGFGQITATVLNTTGVIRAQGGELDLSGAGATVGTAAEIQVPANGSVVYVQGLATNAGTIAVAGGAFHNGNQTLINTGMIEGAGTFDAGAWTNNAGAQMNLTANTNLFGPVANAGAIHLYGTNITFFGNLTNTGTVKVTSGSVYFLGASGANIGGSYISDPSDNYFNSLSITATGSVSGGAGDRFFLLNGTPLTNAGTFDDLGTLSASTVNSAGVFIQTGTLVETGNFTNTGTAAIGGTQNWSHGTIFTNTAGTATFQSDAGATAENLTVNVSSGSVAFASTQHLLSLNISPAGNALISGGGSGHRSVLFTPSLTAAGTLDLTVNDLDVQAANLAVITSLVKQAYTNGTWTGAGITSSSAAADPARLTAIGVILNTTYISFDGAAVAINDVLAKDTYYGDTNLDGKVDGTDYSRIDNGFLVHATGWFNGDLNYDGVVNGSDYTLIDNAYNSQGAALTAEIADPSAGTAFQLGNTSSVPEPAALSLMTITAALLSSRRRRRSF